MDTIFTNNSLGLPDGKKGAELKTYIRQNYPRLLQSARRSMPENDYLFFCQSMWMYLNLPSEDDLENQRKAQLPYNYLISVIIPVYNVKEEYLTELLDSVYAQTYTHFEICIADGASKNPKLREIIVSYQEKYGRLKYIFLEKNLGISGNTNAAIDLSQGEYLAFIDHDDIITPDALYETAKAIYENPGAGLIYTDSFRTYENDLFALCIKPDWNNTLFLQTNYIVHLVIAERALIYKAGMLNPEYDMYQDTELFFRLSEMTRIHHIPKPLYYWREVTGSVSVNLKKSTEQISQLKERVNKAKTEHILRTGSVDYTKNPARISVIIELPDSIERMHELITGLINESQYGITEIVTLYTRQTDPAVRACINSLRKSGIFKAYAYSGNTAPAAYFNRAAARCTGNYIVFINKDVTINSEKWTNLYLALIGIGKCAAVGCNISVTDANGDKLYTSGCEYIGNNADIGEYYKPVSNEAEKLLFSSLTLESNSECTSLVKGCVMIKKSVFDEYNGFDESLPEYFYLSDFCVRAADNGYVNKVARTVNINRPINERTGSFDDELVIFAQRYQKRLSEYDPAFTPHLSVINYMKYGCPYNL